MAPKRKLPAATREDRFSKRSSPTVETPQSVDSNDDFSDPGSDYEQESRAQAIEKFSFQHKKAARTKFLGSSDGRSKIRDLSSLTLKIDHQNRPLWIEPEGAKIYLESFNPLAKYAQDFLTSIAEPQSRPSHIHEYAISIHSLYTAMSVGLTANDIIVGLNKFLKTPLSPDMVSMIQESTKLYGKVKLVLKHNRYFLETPDATILQKILRDSELAEAGLGSSSITTEVAPTSTTMTIPGTSDAAGMKEASGSVDSAIKDKQPEDSVSMPHDAVIEAIRADDDDDEEEEQKMIHSVEVPKQNIQLVMSRSLAMGYPLLEEYDFNNDQVNAKLEIDLRPGTKIRDYQEKSLAKMFSNGRARSGIIVLPCGAGKTLVGVTAACTIRRSVIVLATSEMSVVQWRNEFLKWSNINPDDIATFTAGNKQKFSRKAGIIVATYHMVTYSSGKRSHEAQKMMDFLQEREWGLMLLDEVHVVPADMFRKVGSSISAHSKLGLTATLLREDNKITDLNFLIGPKLYEANWMELSNQGHIARVQCAEVWCPMTAEFYAEHLREKSRKRGLLCVMNPRKLQACQFLIDYHERRGDKIIVFSDNVYALERYAIKLGKPYIYGETSQQERMKILDNFQHNDQVNTIFLSKIGDTSLDLPEATCLIQVSSHYASRRQEAQRLGRILRAKRRNDEGFNAFFYSLVSKDTEEMKYSSKRQAFLVDQGYAFKVITHLKGIETLPNLAYSTPREQRELLQEVLLQNESAADQEDVQGDLFSRVGRVTISNTQRSKVRRQAGTLPDLSGAQDMAYIEYNKSKNKELAKASKGKTLQDRLKAQRAKEQERVRNMMTR